MADDDPAILRLVTAVVEKEGYTAAPARDGHEAYKLLQTEGDFAACVLDIMMPHIEGPELVRYMKTEKRLMKIPVMMMTAEQNLKLSSDSFAPGRSSSSRSLSPPRSFRSCSACSSTKGREP